MSSPLTPSAFVERLLEAEEPVWHRWDRDLPALLSELITVAHREFAMLIPERGMGRVLAYRRQRRIFWLLDRFTPESQGESFEPFLGDARAQFAWARRLPSERRHELIDLARDHKRPDVLMMAWCVSCPDDDLSSLLDWTESWKSVPKAGCYMERPHPEDEFYSRFTDVPARYQLLCDHLAKACQLFRSGCESEQSSARQINHRVLRMVLKDAATMSPCPDGPEPDSNEWRAWLQRMLQTCPFTEAVNAAGEFLRWFQDPRPPMDEAYRAQWVWVHAHGHKDWRHLREMAYSESEWFVFDRLADITPTDQLDVWSGLIQYESEDHGQMRAFCRWLPSEYSHVMQSHFSHPNTDWAACAYQCHLAKSPEPVLSWEWGRRCEIPAWQVKLLDRRLFAPEALRPRPYVEDIQDAECDFRLEEPFSRRGI